MKSNSQKILFWIAAILIIAVSVFIVIDGSEPDPVDPGLTTISDSDWTKGSPDAKVQIVEYSDLQCPACAFVESTIVAPILEEYKDDIYFAFRHYPLKSIHSNAVEAAIAAEAAGLQDKFFEMTSLLYEKQQDWDILASPEAQFEDYAEQLGLDIEKFRSDSDSQELMDKVENAYQFATSKGLRSTPSIYLNGEKLDDLKDAEDFKKRISDELS